MMEGRRAETLRLGMVGVCIAGLVAALAPQAQGQERLGLLTASRGQVSIVRAPPPPGRVVPVRARVREELFAGDVVKTGVRAKAKLLLRDDSLIILAGETELEITQALFEPAAGRRSTTVRLLQGIARAVVQPIDNPRPDSRFSIETPTAVMGVRGSEGACQVTKKDEKWKTKCCSRRHPWDVASTDTTLSKRKRKLPERYCTEILLGKAPMEPWPMTPEEEERLFPSLFEEAFNGPTDGGDTPVPDLPDGRGDGWPPTDGGPSGPWELVGREPLAGQCPECIPPPIPPSERKDRVPPLQSGLDSVR